MVMVVVVMMRSQVIAGNVAATFFGHGAHGFSGDGVVVRAADVHLDGRRFCAVV